MEGKSYPQLEFKRGDFLTTEMLAAGYDSPHQFLAMRYSDYGDGFITGGDFVCDDNCHIWLTEGLLKWREEFFFLTRGEDLTAYLDALEKQSVIEQGRSYYVGLKQVDASHDSLQQITLILDVQTKLDDDMLMLGRITWNGAKLFKLPPVNLAESEPFLNFTNDFYWNLLDTSYACSAGATYHPLIFRAVAEYLRQKDAKSQADFCLLMEIECHKVVPIAAILTYMQASGRASSDLQDRQALFVTLCHVLTEPAAMPVLATADTREETADEDGFHSMILP